MKQKPFNLVFFNFIEKNKMDITQRFNKKMEKHLVVIIVNLSKKR